MSEQVIAVDLAQVNTKVSSGDLIRVLSWGDYVDVVNETAEHLEVRITKYDELPDGSIQPETVNGFIRPSKSSGLKAKDIVRPTSENDVLKINFVDVQQGDAAVIETPKGKVVLIDGGDNQLFARYLANRYRNTSLAKPRKIDAIVVTHGDADHFSGLTKINESEVNPTPAKRLFIYPERVYHNGLVKRPTKRNGVRLKETEALGATTKVGGKTVITGLESDLLNVPDREMNEPFLNWKRALETYNQRGKAAGLPAIEFKRLKKGDSAFGFLAGEGVSVDVLAPLITKVGAKDGLTFLGKPPRGPRIGHESLATVTSSFKGASASHTINGHSIVLRLKYGAFTYLFTGDLNDQSSRDLVTEAAGGQIELRSEVLKVPHHGSADFSAAFIQAVSPVISVVSSGDESEQKEYIHPRATLVGALGKYSRVEEPLVFITELVAFFKTEGYVQPEAHVLKNNVLVDDPKAKSKFFAFSRTAFGIVKTRTDGKRLVVYTNSGQADLKEVYAYELDQGLIQPTAVRQT